MIAPVTALAAALSAAPAVAEASYPTALERDAIAAWLPQATGLAAQQVIAVTSSAVVAIVARDQAPDGRARLLLRALPLTADASMGGGVLAWQMRLEIDCRAGAIRLGATTGYASRAAAGDGVALAPAEASWRSAKAGTPLDNAWRAACEPGFQPPLVAAGPQLARATPAPTPTPLPPPGASSAPAFARNATAQAQTRANIAPPKPGLGAVQVVSSPKEADTRQVLASLQVHFGAQQGLQTRVEPAQVRGRTVYRGVVAGFSSRDQARAFCETLKRSGRDCLAR